MTEAILLKLAADFAGGNESCDGGLLLLRQAERKIGVCRRPAEAMTDYRDQSRVRHQMFELVAARAFAIGCGYTDGSDLKSFAGRSAVEDGG